MGFRTLSLLILAALLGVFVWQNWAMIIGTGRVDAQPVSSSFLWTQLPMAPGIVLLGAMLVLSAMYIVYSAQVRASTFVETRRWAREVETARKLADEAEASRFEQLRELMQERLEQLEAGLRNQMEQSHNVLAAHIAEFEDRVMRDSDIGPRRVPGEPDDSPLVEYDPTEDAGSA